MNQQEQYYEELVSNGGNKNTKRSLNAGKEKLRKIFPLKAFGHLYNLILSRKYLTGRCSAFLILQNCQSLYPNESN